MNFKAFSLAFLILISGNVCVGQSLVSSLYCSIFGNQEIRPEYKELAVRALTDLGVQDPESVPVKQMNGVGPAFARVDLSSFTAFGIWLDEEYLDGCTQEEKIFHIYHEAAHYACKHHQKTVAGSAVTLACLAYLLSKCYDALDSEGPVIKYTLFTACTTGLLGQFYLYYLPKAVKYLEKQADILAVKTLISIGRPDVVFDHIRRLKESIVYAQDSMWWFSAEEQLRYIEEAVQEAIQVS